MSPLRWGNGRVGGLLQAASAVHGSYSRVTDPRFDAVVLLHPDARERVGGLSLAERAAFTLARAGARRLLMVAAPGRPTEHEARLPDCPITWVISDDVAAVAAWTAAGTRHLVVSDARTVTDPATVAALALAQGERGVVQADSARLWRCDATDLGRFLAAAQTRDPATPTQTAIDPAIAVRPWEPPAGALLVDATDAARRETAERRLYARLGRPGDGWFTRVVDRRISRVLTRWLLPTGITPNQITIASMVIGMTGGILLASGHTGQALAGALLFLASTILDGCDGEIARLTFRESRLGQRLDLIGDNAVHVVLFSGIAVGLYRHTRDPRIAALGIALVAGALLAMATVYWCFVRQQPNARQRALFEAFASREFAYLLVVLTAAGKLEWFLWASALGTYVFVVALLLLGRRPQ